MQSQEPPSTADPFTNRNLPLWLVVLGSGLVAGSVAGFVGEITYPALHNEPEYPPVSTSSAVPSEPCRVRSFGSKPDRRRKPTRRWQRLGRSGEALGLVMGLAGCLSGGRRRASLEGAAIGGTLGALAGAGLSTAIVPLVLSVFGRHDDGASASPDPRGDLCRAGGRRRAGPGVGLG